MLEQSLRKESSSCQQNELHYYTLLALAGCERDGVNVPRWDVMLKFVVKYLLVVSHLTLKNRGKGTNNSLENASIQRLVRYHGRLLLHREVMERAGLTETGVPGKDHGRICICHPIETVIKHASFMWKGSTYSQVYSLTVFSKSDSTIINPAVTESNTTVEDNPTDAEEHASSSTDNEPSEDVSSPLPNKKRTFMVRTVGQTHKSSHQPLLGNHP